MEGIMSIFRKISEWFEFTSGGIQIYKLYISNDKINDFVMDVLSIIFILILMYVAVKVGNHIIEKTVKKQSNMRISMDERKAKTLGAVLMSILRYTVYFFGVSAILSRIFGTISITFASIGGVAIGFGAQSLVKDIINGFFILFENHFAVGEYINIDTKAGIVESVELRVTKLRDFNGDLHIIPNGLITQVTNHSRGDMRVLVDVDIAYEENTENAIQVIQNTCDRFRESNENMVEGPKVIGVTALRESGVTIRVVGKAKSMTQWECEHKLRKEIKDTLSEAGIEIPYPKRKIVN
jgi:small-conductance mechanosensitive channel